MLSSPRTCVIMAIPIGKVYIIINTIATSRYCKAWYVEAIKITEIKLEKKMGRIRFLYGNTALC